MTRVIAPQLPLWCNRLVSRLFTLLIVCSAALAVANAQCPAAPKQDQSKLLDALSQADFGTVYSDDGCGCDSVTEKGQLIESGPNIKPDARVKAIIDLKSSAIPVLIAHLDDVQKTRTLFDGKPAPLGYVALDILMSVIAQPNAVLFPDCADDGLGACINPKYYFRPDASVEEMKVVKKNWHALCSNGQIVFQYPTWWR